MFSNLSLQVLNLKSFEFYYDEYLSFDTDKLDSVNIIFVDSLFKPVLNHSIFEEFLQTIINEKNIFISNSLKTIKNNETLNFYNKVILKYGLNFIEIESIIGKDYKTKCSVLNLEKFQFPYNFDQLSRIKKYFRQINESKYSIPLKAICVDFDNTLWEGIIGENITFDNLFLSSNYIFTSFQKFLFEQKDKGILLCLVTKNNFNDVEEFFKKNNMPLSLDDFIIIKSNWRNKSTNIIDIARDLNLSYESFLFIDDSDFEIEEVKMNCPCIYTLKFILDSKYFNYNILSNPVFFKKENTIEDLERNKNYKEEIQRKKVVLKDLKSESFLNKNIFDKLKVKLKFFKNNESDFDRISQLSEKTNQFNFNKKVILVSELKELVLLGYNVFSCSASDSYGDYGIISYIIFNAKKDVDNYVVSCRALGRHIEFAFFNYCVLEQKIKDKLKINFKKNTRNIPAEIFLKSLNSYYGKKNNSPRISVIY